MTIDLGILVAFVLIIIGQMIWVIREWRRSGLEHPNWTSSDRKEVRTLRAIMLSGVAAAWVIVLVQVALHPDLTHGAKLLTIAMLPLLLTSSTLTLSFIAPRRGFGGGFRAFTIVGALICVGVLGTSLTILALAWATHQ